MNFVNNDLGIHYVELEGIIDYKTIIHEIHEHFIDLIFSLEVHEKEIDKKGRSSEEVLSDTK